MTEINSNGDPKSLPHGWQWATIGEITRYVSRGRAPKYADKDGVTVINQKCVRWHGIEWEHVRSTTRESAERLSEEQFLVPGDVLWNSTGTGTIGRAVVFRPRDPKEHVVADTHVTILRPAACNPQLLQHWIFSDSVQRELDRMQTGSTNQVELSRRKVLETRIPIPPAAEQIRIVAKLDELFSRIEKGEENLKRVQALVKQYRQSVLKAAVTGELTRDWREKHGGKGETGAELLQRILAARRASWESAELKKMKTKGKTPKDDKWKQKYKEPAPAGSSSLPELPEGWVWASVNQVALVSGGLTKNSKRAELRRKMPYLRVANVYQNELRLDDVQDIGVKETEVEKVTLKKGDLLIVEGNGSIEQIGRVAIWDGSIDACLHQNHLIKARFVESVLAEFALVWLLSPGGRHFIREVASSTSGLHTLSISKIDALPIPLPNVGELQLIKDRFDEMETLKGQLSAAIAGEVKRASAFRQGVLRSGFSGNLVPQDPNDESASTILERVAAERATWAPYRPEHNGPKK